MCVGFVLYITTHVLVSTIVSDMPIMHQQVKSAVEKHFKYVFTEAQGREAEMSRKKHGKTI